MRKFLLAGLGVLFLLASAEGALAACASPAVMHDFPGTAFNMSLATAPDGNCASNVSQPNLTSSGTITSTQNVAITPTLGQSTISVQVTGTWTGTLFVEASVDGTNFSQTTIVPVLSGSVQTATITANGIWQANGAGFASFRVRGNSVASGTATVTLVASTGTSTVMADNPFPVTGYTGMTALNVIGNTTIGSATTDKPLLMGGSSTGASGGNAQVAKVDSSGNQYIIAQGTGASGSALSGNPFRVALSDGTNTQNWLAAIALSDGVNGNNTGAVASWLWNGTTYDRAYGDKTDGAWVNVKASALPTGAATAANQTNKAQFTQLTDGTNAATAYTAYGTAPTGNVPGANVFVTNTNQNVGGGSPVTNGADNWNTIAASQTSQKLSATSGGTTGATGDYLSHCTIQPTTTAAGTVTIADLTTTIYTFTSGTLSNLVPFTIPVGAISKNGAWEVTTGANVTVTCVGHFS